MCLLSSSFLIHSQFFITFAAQKQLDGKHVVFGCVAKGVREQAYLEILKRINDECASQDGSPRQRVELMDCGVL